MSPFESYLKVYAAELEILFKSHGSMVGNHTAMGYLENHIKSTNKADNYSKII